jgi:hypothetical protein
MRILNRSLEIVEIDDDGHQQFELIFEIPTHHEVWPYQQCPMSKGSEFLAVIVWSVSLCPSRMSWSKYECPKE